MIAISQLLRTDGKKPWPVILPATCIKSNVYKIVAFGKSIKRKEVQVNVLSIREKSSY